jgi:hypothetical protein
MIDQVNLDELFRELDAELTARGLKRKLVIYGGAALIHQKILDRATVDVDVFQPKIDKDLARLIAVVGKKHLLGDHWINSTGSAFLHESPAGWEKRVQNVFQGESLEIQVLGRLDLLFAKLLAELDRQEDLPDLRALRPTPKELSQLEPHLLKLDSNPKWESKVKSLISILIKDGAGWK